MHKLDCFSTDFLELGLKMLTYCKAACTDEAGFLILEWGASNIEKIPYFSHFWPWKMYELFVSQLIFFKTGAKFEFLQSRLYWEITGDNLLYNTFWCTEPDFWFWAWGPPKIEKHTVLDDFDQKMHKLTCFSTNIHQIEKQKKVWHRHMYCWRFLIFSLPGSSKKNQQLF